MESLIVDNKSHTILSAVQSVTLHLLCGACGDRWTVENPKGNPACPKCKTALPAFGLPQNVCIRS